jgi:hypothetical protein
MTYSRYRLEGDTRATEIETGLQARIADALWMLARQWQVGEFRGEDASSPVQARYQMETTPVTELSSYRSRTYAPIDPLVPLEAYVEPQSPGELAGFWRSAEAGMHLLRLLSARGLDSLRSDIRRDYPLPKPARVEPAESAWVRVLVRRACDGARIFRERDAVAAAIRRSLSPEQQAAFDGALTAWEQWYQDRLLDQPGTTCWDPERMEYRFRLRASLESGAVILNAGEYPGGHLDWFSFDAQFERSDRPAQTARHDPKTVLPAPVQFAGMAASRWWELEDGKVNFGDVDASAVDFARMITAAFATGFGDDWFVIPVRVPIGSLAQVVFLEVLDSFGDAVPIDSVASQDGGQRSWRYFELKGDRADPMLFVPAVALGRLEGRALESVTMIRDETENLGWGIESRYEGIMERAVERMEQWAGARAEAAPPEETALWTYRLLNPIPPHWIPFVPVRTGPNAQIRLRRGRMSEWELLPDRLAGIRGRTLLPNPAAPLLMYEEEIPASGIEITGSYQFVRQVSGESVVWLGMRKRPARKLSPINRETDAVRIPAPGPA